ncbi:MAG: ABC transporter permease subunit [Acidobacteriota bacterium]
MIKEIVKNEIRSNLLSYKFFIAILLTSLLLSLSIFIMYKDYKERLSDYHIIKPKPEEPIVVLPPNPLSIFVKGVDEAMTRSFEISVTRIRVGAGQKASNPIFSFYPTVDFLYVIKVILSLVALLFGFDRICGEKESGTLRVLLCNNISRANIVFGKWIGNFLCLVLPFLIISLLTFLIINIDPQIKFSSDHASRFLILLSISIFYISVFFTLGFLISSITRKSSTSLVVLLFLWAILVFVIPNSGSLIARGAKDLPSVKSINQKRQHIWIGEVFERIQERKIGKGETLKDWASRVEKISSENDKLDESYRIKFDKFIDFVKSINRISPVSSYIFSMMDISGTGIGEERNLKRELITYKNRILPFLYQTEKPSISHAFKYNQRSISEILLEGAFLDLFLIIFWNIMFFTLAYYFFAKYDAR